MSIRLMDSTQLYGAVEGASVPLGEAGYTSNGFSSIDIVAGAGKFGGNTFRCSNALVKLKYYWSGGGPTSKIWIMGAYVLWEGWAGAQYNFMEIGRPAGELSESVNCGIRRGNDGSIEIYDSTDTKVASSAASVIATPFTTYYYIEFKAYEDDSAGYATVKVNGTQVVTVSSIDTRANAGYANEVRWKAQAGGVYMNFDQLVVFDGDGEAWEVRDFIGPKRLWVLGGTADTAQEDWDRSAGSDSYALINDTAPGGHNGDTDYLQEDTNLGQTRVAVANLPGIINPVALNTVITAKDISGLPAINHVLKSGTVHFSNLDYNLNGGSWKANRRVWPRDPASGGIPWTDSAVNALEKGVRHTELV